MPRSLPRRTALVRAPSLASLCRLPPALRLALAALLALLVSLDATAAAAQITPPGLGEVGTAAWTALGVKQTLDGARRREYVGYLGVGSTSRPDGHSPYGRPAILVLNQELYDHFHPRWLYALALSYRRQNELALHDGVAHEVHLQELRLYGRYALVLARRRVHGQLTFRPELRGFVGGDFSPVEQPFQLRLRLKAQAGVALDRAGAHRLIGSAEALASVARDRTAASRFTELAYRESRFALFYAIRARERVVVDVGYMNDLLGCGAQRIDVHYLALDVVWLNPFGAVGT